MLLAAIKFLLIVTIVVSGEAASEDTTDYVYLPFCKKDDPDVSQCLIEGFEMVRENLTKGIPELKIPPIDPWFIPVLKLEQAKEKSTFKAVLMDVKLYGLGQYNISEFMTNFEDYTTSGTINIPHVYLDAEFMLLGNFQMLPIESSGRIMANFTDNIIKFNCRGGVVKKSTGLHYMLNGLNVDLDIDSIETNLDDLYSSSDVKGQIFEHMINLHSKEIFPEIKTSIETVTSMLIDEIAGKFFMNIPLDKLFAD